MKIIENYEDAIFNIAKDINESYPLYLEDHGVKHKEVDKEKIIHSINKHSDFRLEENNSLTFIITIMNLFPIKN